MSEDLHIATGSKRERYESLLPQIRALMEGETDQVANLANLVAALKEQFGWLWVGFYLVKDDQLVVGPFQGPVASEIVVPVLNNGKVCGVLDCDSVELNAFDEEDRRWLEELVRNIPGLNLKS
jgi:L-methionine (R)-S-oxide reductase